MALLSGVAASTSFPGTPWQPDIFKTRAEAASFVARVSSPWPGEIRDSARSIPPSLILLVLGGCRRTPSADDVGGNQETPA